jgi:hypothetical protein
LVESPYAEVGMIATAFYFIFLLILVSAIGLLEPEMTINDSKIDNEPSVKQLLVYKDLNIAFH